MGQPKGNSLLGTQKMCFQQAGHNLGTPNSHVKQERPTARHNTCCIAQSSNACIRPLTDACVLPGIQEDVLADRQPKLVLRRRQRKAVAPHVVAQHVLLGQPELELLLRVERHGRHR